ncbi:MAG: TIGR04282 family arsenosugar biosynthesis glycosyltransferase [Mariprofundaceae bacterium]
MNIRPIVLCKAPIAGEVKTRLMPDFTPERAADTHAKMAEASINRMGRLFTNSWITSNKPAHPFFAQFGMRCLQQPEGDLGARLSLLLCKAMDEGAEAVLFVGTDSPHIADSRLQAAIQLLKHYDVVIGPVEDGGYDLIAIRGYYPELFSSVPWSTDKVLSVTRSHLSRLGLRYRLLSIGFDIDRFEDLKRAIRSGFRE